MRCGATRRHARDALARVDARPAHPWHLAPPYMHDHRLLPSHALRVQPARALDPDVLLRHVLLVRTARTRVVGIDLRAEEQVHGPWSFIGRLVVVAQVLVVAGVVVDLAGLVGVYTSTTSFVICLESRLGSMGAWVAL